MIREIPVTSPVVRGGYAAPTGEMPRGDMTLGAWMRHTRKAKGMKIAHCARIAGMTGSQWGSLESDRPNPSRGCPPKRHRRTLSKIARGLGVLVRDVRRAAFGAIQGSTSKRAAIRSNSEPDLSD